MDYLNEFTDTLLYKAGQEIYYTGDQANSPAWGRITAVIPENNFHGLRYECEFDGRKRIIEHFFLKPQLGQRYKSREQMQAERDYKNQQLHNFLKSCK